MATITMSTGNVVTITREDFLHEVRKQRERKREKQMRIDREFAPLEEERERMMALLAEEELA